MVLVVVLGSVHALFTAPTVPLSNEPEATMAIWLVIKELSVGLFCYVSIHINPILHGSRLKAESPTGN